jgi:hypothetical protein
MGEFRYHFPVLIVEWWSSFDGVWRHPCSLWKQFGCVITGRNGLHVRLLEFPSTQLLLLIIYPLVILSSEHSIDGPPTLRPLLLGSGDSFKVRDLLGLLKSRVLLYFRLAHYKRMVLLYRC